MLTAARICKATLTHERGSGAPVFSNDSIIRPKCCLLANLSIGLRDWGRAPSTCLPVVGPVCLTRLLSRAPCFIFPCDPRSCAGVGSSHVQPVPTEQQTAACGNRALQEPSSPLHRVHVGSRRCISTCCTSTALNFGPCVTKTHPTHTQGSDMNTLLVICVALKYEPLSDALCTFHKKNGF